LGLKEDIMNTFVIEEIDIKIALSYYERDYQNRIYDCSLERQFRLHPRQQIES